MSFLNNLFSKNDPPIKTHDDLWTWFAHHQKTFYKVVNTQENIESDFFDKLSPKLRQVKDGIFYLTGMLDENTAELVLTPDGSIPNIVFVEDLVSKAPAIPGWKFTALKPAMGIESTYIEMDGYKFNRDTISFYPSEDPNYPDDIDITLVHHNYNEDDKDTIIGGTYLFLDNFLGELKSITSLDNVQIIGKDKATQELIPIEKLESYIDWREKEFVEKYHGAISDTQDMAHSVLEAETEDGSQVIAVINTTILDWERKASHPWILVINIPYDGKNNNGLPGEDTNDALLDLENGLNAQLKDHDGYILIGHESVDNLRTIYFACNDFRKPSKVAHQMTLDNLKWNVTYKIYKDKYWRSFNRFKPAL